jgi:glutamate carboxypeptidase
MRHHQLLAALALVTGAAASAHAQAPAPLPAREQRIRAAAERRRAEQVAYLERVVNIPSGTLNLAGVREVGRVFARSLDSLGFTTRWIAMPAATGRAGHLVAEHRGKKGTTRMLLIGHLDTVFEGEGQRFVREDTVARGAGSGDMKGGDVIMLYALKALHDAGALKNANVTVVLTGDEESAGEPLDVTRRDLVDAARRADVALAFEGGNRANATVARRGSSGWELRVTGRQAHSAGVFGESAGFGAVYEGARIVDEFRRALAGEPNLTFNAAVFLGGTDVAYDTARVAGTGASKQNIVARSAVVAGDLRFLTEEQKERARARMREIVARSLPGTSAAITFSDAYPSMSPTPGNLRLLAVYDSASQALGYGAVAALDAGRRGAGDISFVASLVDGLDGLGALGAGAHSPDERVDLNALAMQTERAALLIDRLARRRLTPRPRALTPPAARAAVDSNPGRGGRVGAPRR